MAQDVVSGQGFPEMGVQDHATRSEIASPGGDLTGRSWTRSRLEKKESGARDSASFLDK